MNEVARHMDALNFLCRALRIELPSTNLRGHADLTEEDVDELDSDSDDPIISSSHEYLRGSNYIKKFLGLLFTSLSLEYWNAIIQYLINDDISLYSMLIKSNSSDYSKSQQRN